MTPQKLPLSEFTEGDEWEGIPSLAIQVGPTGGPFAPPANPLSVVTMRFKKAGCESSAVVVLSSATNQINITDAANWAFEIPPQIVAGLTYGKWIWRIRCTDNSETGSPKTYLADEISVLETV